MRVGALALAVVLALVPVAAFPQTSANGPSIRYIFPTLLVPEIPAERSKTVPKDEPWFFGKAVPAHATVLDADVPIPGTAFVLPRGTILSVATSDYLIGCQDKTVAPGGVGGMGRLPLCLVDLDRDGRFDGWFKSSIMLLWGCCNGHLERSHVRPITPVGTTELSAEQVRALKPWGLFSIRYIRGMLTYCAGMGTDCLSKAPRITPSAEEQATEFMGGLFAYRRLDDGQFAVRMVREPKEATY